MSDSSAPLIDEKKLRKQAMWRSNMCPGAGFALIGRSEAGLATYCVAVAVVWAIGLLVLFPLPIFFWVSGSLLVAAVLAWLSEQVCVFLLPVRPDGEPSLLKRHYVACALVGWVSSLAVSLLLVFLVRAAWIGRPEMAPTLEQDELVGYQKSVDAGRLSAGRVVAIQSGANLMICRIWAVGGDRVKLKKGVFVVNDRPGPSATFVPFGGILNLADGDERTVPPDSYFVATDNPIAAVDSRTLGWIARKDVVSTRVFHLGWKRGMMEEVK